MSFRELSTCDVCGAEKRETDHWLLSEKSRLFVLRHWDTAAALSLHFIHACGAKCAHTLLDDWLTERQQERTK